MAYLFIYVFCIAISDRVNAEGTFLVTSHYGTLANAVAGDCSPAPTPEVIHEAVRIIHKGLIKLKQEIKALGTVVENFNPQDVTRLRRSLAVMVFLAHRALSGMETKSVQHVLGSGNVGKGGKSSGPTVRKYTKNTCTSIIYACFFCLEIGCFRWTRRCFRN